MSDWVVYGKDGCEWCDKAVELLEFRGETPRKVWIDHTNRSEILQTLHMHLGEVPKTVPVIFHKGNHVGGYMQLEGYLRVGDR